MATCDITCTYPESTQNPSCPTKIVIPDIPTNAPKIDLPTAKDVTEETLSGKGVFDSYMRAGKAHLDDQYEKGRIKGSDYTQAYIAMLQLMMTEANKFVTGLVQAEIAAQGFGLQFMTAGYDAALKREQAKKMQSEAGLVCQQLAELKENGAVERTLKRAQRQVQIMQAKLYEQQIGSFKDKTKIDAAKTLYDAWAVNAVEEPDAATWALAELKGSSMVKTNNSIKTLAGGK